MPQTQSIAMKSLSRSKLSAFLVPCLLILAATTLSATGWQTSGVQIDNPSGAPFIITGVNWYGFETTAYVAHGMYTKDYTFILNEVKQFGYNTVRLPFSNQMWESDPIPSTHYTSACPTCSGKHGRDVMALILNYAGSIGLHVILDNHRSEAGSSNQANGLWYITGHNNYPESSWTNDWVHILDWVHGIQQTQGSTDTVTVNYLASDGFPVVIGFDLRNEPHTVCSRTGCNYPRSVAEPDAIILEARPGARATA